MPNVAAWIGHNYLGPGNPFPNGKPVDKADEVAYIHDKSYVDLQKVADQLSDSEWYHKVHEADLQAIHDFDANYRKDPGDYWSAAGSAGLTSKLAGERQAGRILYPPKSIIAGKHVMVLWRE